MIGCKSICHKIRLIVKMVRANGHLLAPASLQSLRPHKHNNTQTRHLRPRLNSHPTRNIDAKNRRSYLNDAGRRKYLLKKLAQNRIF